MLQPYKRALPHSLMCTSLNIFCMGSLLVNIYCTKLNVHIHADVVQYTFQKISASLLRNIKQPKKEKKKEHVKSSKTSLFTFCFVCDSVLEPLKGSSNTTFH